MGRGLPVRGDLTMTFPTHNCTVVTYDGDELSVISPMSMLDCDKPECRRRTALASQGADYNIDSIRVQLAGARELVASAMDSMQLWELVLEAKERLND